MLPNVFALPSEGDGLNNKGSDVTVHQKQGMAAYIVTVTVHRVPQMRESGLRCALVLNCIN